MPKKHSRQIGTTAEAIARAEAELGFTLPPSFREWLLKNNGLGEDGVSIFPVFDERDPRMTWDSIVRQNEGGQWPGEPFEDEGRDFCHLLPFADYGTGDYYCFDYSRRRADGEVPVVRWSHETGECEDRGETFDDFLRRLRAGEFTFD